jgi:hypothetical protein
MQFSPDSQTNLKQFVSGLPFLPQAKKAAYKVNKKFKEYKNEINTNLKKRGMPHLPGKEESGEIGEGDEMSFGGSQGNGVEMRTTVSLSNHDDIEIEVESAFGNGDLKGLIKEGDESHDAAS